MYIVTLGGDPQWGVEPEIHSAWNTPKEANKQATVLREHGYTRVYTRNCEGLTCENGTYFV